MQKFALVFGVAASVVATAAAPPSPRVGDAFQIVTDRETEKSGNRNENQRGTSTDRESYVERVVAVRAEGSVLEYDLPPDATPDDRANNWQFPFRVLKTGDGALRLLNAPELAARVDRWLKAAGMQRAICGNLIFTWNAFRVECDPQSVVKWAATVTLPRVLEAGTRFTDPDALAPATLQRVSTNRLIATLVVDPAAVRRQRAQTDVEVAELMHKPLTLNTALKAHEAESITGRITVTFDLDSTGRVRRRTRVRRVQIALANGRVDTQTVTDTLTRTPLSAASENSQRV